MSTQTVFDLMSQIRTLSLEDQRKLNKMLVQNIDAGIKRQCQEISCKLDVGDVVSFDGKTRGMITIKVTEFSRDLTKVKGIQLNPGMKTPKGTKWTVHAAAVKPVPMDLQKTLEYV
jgi:Flp pilus assembly secretin CpaC